MVAGILKIPYLSDCIRCFSGLTLQNQMGGKSV
jgi:hypothetical protein